MLYQDRLMQSVEAYPPLGDFHGSMPGGPAAIADHANHQWHNRSAAASAVRPLELQNLLLAHWRRTVRKKTPGDSVSPCHRAGRSAF
jgi:hypothetical protein